MQKVKVVIVMEMTQEEFAKGLGSHKTINDAMLAGNGEGEPVILGGFTRKEISEDGGIMETVKDLMS